MSDRRPRGNPDFRLLASDPAKRARVRHDRKLAREADELSAAGLKYAEIALRWNSRNRRSWRGRSWTPESVGRLLRQWRSAPSKAPRGAKEEQQG